MAYAFVLDCITSSRNWPASSGYRALWFLISLHRASCCQDGALNRFPIAKGLLAAFGAGQSWAFKCTAAGDPLQWEHRRLLHKLLSSVGSTPSSGASAPTQRVLQSTQSTAADVAARLLFRHNPSMSLDRILNTSFGADIRQVSEHGLASSDALFCGFPLHGMQCMCFLCHAVLGSCCSGRLQTSASCAQHMHPVHLLHVRVFNVMLSRRRQHV